MPLLVIASGGEQTVNVAREARCEKCDGSGAAPGTQPRRCEKCQGSGRLTHSEQRGDVTMQQITTCPDCRGIGSFIDTPCADCGGSGTTYREESLTVRIPAGAEEGMALRIPGRGEQSPEASTPPGDLYVIVRSEADPRFERHGVDLWSRLRIELVDAVLGTKVNAPTLDGDVEVDVPAGTQPDSVLRLRGKGLPHFGYDKRGDLYIRIDVHVPEKLSRHERQLYEELREGGGSDEKRWFKRN